MRSLSLGFLVPLMFADVSSELLAQEPTKILCVGDSLTFGSCPGSNGYRQELWQMLRPTRCVDFIGPLQNANEPFLADFDPDHASASGRTAEEAAYFFSLIPAGAAGFDADIALVHLGTNDLDPFLTALQSTITVPPIPSLIATLIEGRLLGLHAELVRINPAMEVVFAQVAGTTVSELDPVIIELNLLIQNLPNRVPAMFAAQTHVVDVNGAVDPSMDFCDSVHPTPAADQAIALVWYTQLMTMISPDLQFAPCFREFGTGCNGLRLRRQSATLPQWGSTFVMQVDGVPPATTPILLGVVGPSEQSPGLSAGLFPIECPLRVVPLVGAPFFTGFMGSPPTWTYSVPMAPMPLAVDLPIFCQVISLEGGTVTLSNAVELRRGQ